jgi:uncharacterized membrane protein YGL010W
MSTPLGYFGLSLVYGLVAVCVLLIPVVFVNYRVVFQSALLCSMLLPTGALWAALQPSPETGRVARRPKIVFCVATFVSLFLCGVALINPLQYLASECPAVRANASHVDSLAVTVEFARRDPATGLSSDELLLLQYNLTSKRVVHSEVAVRARGAASAKQTWLETEVRQYQALQQPVCSDDVGGAPQFRFLSHELEHALRREQSAVRKQSPMLRISTSSSGSGDGDHGYELLKRLRHRLDMKEVCLYEYEFSILYVVFIFLLFFFQLFALLWYCFKVKDDGGAAAGE